MKKLYSTREFSELTGISVRTLKYWRKSGKLIPKMTDTGVYQYTDVDLMRVQMSTGVGANVNLPNDKSSCNAGSGDEIIIMSEKFYIQPNKNLRLVPNDKISKALFALNEQQNEVAFSERGVGVIERKTDKVRSHFWLSLVEGFTDKTPLAEFDKEILSVCISEQYAGNGATTPDVICRGLTGNFKMQASNDTNELKEEILKSIRKLMGTIVKIRVDDAAEKMGYNDKKPSEFVGSILPACYISGTVNGKDCTVIKFLDKSPVFMAAEKKAQVLTFNPALLNAPKQRNNKAGVKVRNYILQRVEEIKASHDSNDKRKRKLPQTITFDDLFNKCGIDANDKERRFDARKTATNFMEHLKKCGTIKDFKLIKCCEMKDPKINRHKKKFYGIKISLNDDSDKGT